MTIEYNYIVETGELLTISRGWESEQTNLGIIFMKRDLEGRFLEKYVITGQTTFDSVNQEGNINNSYKIETNNNNKQKIIRNDGREYFQYFGDLYEVAKILDNAEKIKTLLDKHPKARVLGYVVKESGAQIYIVEVGE